MESHGRNAISAALFAKYALITRRSLSVCKIKLVQDAMSKSRTSSIARHLLSNQKGTTMACILDKSSFNSSFASLASKMPRSRPELQLALLINRSPKNEIHF